MRALASWALIGGLVAMIMALTLFDWFLFTGGDNAAYYALTKALAEGAGYVDLVAPGTPRHTVYPPGFPALLVPFYWIFGGSMAGLKLASFAAGGVLLLAVWKLGRVDRGVTDQVAMTTVWLVGLSPLFLKYTHYVLSDMAFAAATFLSLWQLTRADRSEGVQLRSWVSGSALAIAAFYIRTAGAALLLAVLLWLGLKKRWRVLGWTSGAFAVATGPWLWWSFRNPPQTGGYLQQVQSSDRLDPESGALGAADLLVRGWDNLAYYARYELSQLLWPFVPPPTWMQAVGVVLGTGMLAFGVWTLIRKRGVTVSELFFATSAGVLMVWPWRGDRFFLPLVPLAWFFMLAGISAVAERIRLPRLGAVAPFVVVAVLLIGAARLVPLEMGYTKRYLDGEEMVGYSTFWEDYFTAARWVSQDDPSAIIMARKPRLAWYWSRRPSLVYPFHGDPQRTWAFVRANDVTHILVESLTEEFLAPTFAAHIDELDLVYAGPHRDVFVLRVGPAP